ncbi:serine protease inhibitor swm-1-like isoform X2 [Aricia agestis]|uniref:serine protease inhibitor swm-1-like isoform X2 n=1 Tax=Aricia agestis TaxID=91739 RepID=UPI001C2050DE|nr:serine protease inhibitor swm-1-like isoform X2 [Aricia agestis]
MDAKTLVVLVCLIQLAASSPFGDGSITLLDGSSPLSVCGENEWTNGCGSPCEETCDAPHVNCVQVCAGNPCRCIEGHVRHNGRCIPLQDCPKKECPPNAVWDFCGQYCTPTCETPEPICPGFCTVPSCICTEGHVKDAEGNCIKKENCPQISGKQ